MQNKIYQLLSIEWGSIQCADFHGKIYQRRHRKHLQQQPDLHHGHPAGLSEPPLSDRRSGTRRTGLPEAVMRLQIPREFSTLDGYNNPI